MGVPNRNHLIKTETDKLIPESHQCKPRKTPVRFIKVILDLIQTTQNKI